jgi:aspartyl-tRNA(Asn)/glutamyl-tRNA(Gln) amidotransferase subunit A
MIQQVIEDQTLVRNISMTQSLYDLPATVLSDHYYSKTLSSVEVTRAVLERVEAWEPHIHATYACDREVALAMARESESRWLRGKPAGPLDGVPVTIKDNIATRGVPSPLGSAATELAPAANDSPPAARLREAGAVFISKTTMPDFGLLLASLSSFYETTRNPWDTTRDTGGSSSGAGAAAAAGCGPLHLGSDIGGSIRQPAALCGVFGFKPSLGRVPIDPPYMGRVAGPMTRTVADAALMMRVLSQPDQRDHMSLPHQALDRTQLACDVKRLRIGLWLDAGNGVTVDPEVCRAVRDAALRFEDAGATVEPLDSWIAPGTLEGMSRFFRMRVRRDLDNLPKDRRDRVPLLVQQALAATYGLTGEEIYDAHAHVFALRAATVAAARAFDYGLSPVFPVPAFSSGRIDIVANGIHPVLLGSFTSVFNYSEQPAASVNCGYSSEGLPIGLQITGRRFDDLGVLQIARAWETMRGPQLPWPDPPALDARRQGAPIFLS